MSDDVWRDRDRDSEDFGPPLFGEDGEATDPKEREQAERLSFGDETGPLPHWTAAPTGEIPRTRDNDGEAPRDPTDDLDVWSSFSNRSPVWSDDIEDLDASLDMPRTDDSQPVLRPAEALREIEGSDISGVIARPRREPGRITIGTDPTGESARRPLPARKGKGSPRDEAARARNSAAGGPASATAGVGGRDMPTAVFVGAVLALVFIAAILSKPLFVLAIVVLIVGLAAVEFFEKVREKGYQPASVVGVIACVAAPVAAYWVGTQALALVMVFAFIAGCISFVGAPTLAANPVPNMSITTMGVAWIGLCGSYGALFLQAQNENLGGVGAGTIGTDTLMLLAIGVVANDVGALLVGSAAGKTPLRAWISPNKSVEGFIGGTVATILAMIIAGVVDRNHTWSSMMHLVMLGVVIAIMAPLGDLAESMFKRNLDVKDFGSLIKGHGGVLDRFDGFLFTLPAVYYLMVVLQPWTEFVPVK